MFYLFIPLGAVAVLGALFVLYCWAFEAGHSEGYARGQAEAMHVNETANAAREAWIGTLYKRLRELLDEMSALKCPSQLDKRPCPALRKLTPGPMGTKASQVPSYE